MVYAQEILKLAAQILKMPVEEVNKHSKAIPEHHAFYFWNPVRGGNAVIISESREVLSAASAVRFEDHLKAFLSGKRN